MTAVPKDFELAIRSSHDIPCSPGYEIASPPRPAVLVGLIIAAFAMGIVAIQISAYSSRFWKEHKLAVIFVKGLYLYNLVSLGILCQALYRWSITGFRGGNHNHANHEVARRYALVMIPGVISRSVVSCVLGVVGASREVLPAQD
ncbi:hypothetical protein DL93DRAFT_2165488 [Clavulina sp. PMI_390]|nr:hypothetical protein DL93DRAFT_2165488 [Clavulina sp. PMI_390]